MRRTVGRGDCRDADNLQKDRVTPDQTVLHDHAGAELLLPLALCQDPPGRSAQQAVQKVHQHLIAGYSDVVDADLSKYFDTIPHRELMQCVARRIVDGTMLHLIKMWLSVPAEETDEKGKRHYRGGGHK